MTHPKRFAVFDIDGTLIRWQLLHAVIDQLGQAGHFETEAYESLRAARQSWKARKGDEEFKAYEGKLVELIVGNLTKLPVEAFDAAVASVFEEYRDQTYIYTRQLLKELKQQGYLLFAVSGSPQEIVAMLAAHYGFDDFIGTDHKRAGNKFTGEIMVAVFDKPGHVRSLMTRHDVGTKGSVAVGDSEGDIAMLDMVEQPIAFNPSKKLFRHAEAQGWKIVIERKNMIYELEKRGGQYQLTGTNAGG